MAKISDYNTKDFLSKTTFKIRIKHSMRTSIRLWIGVKILWIGCSVIGVKPDIVTRRTDG